MSPFSTHIQYVYISWSYSSLTVSPFCANLLSAWNWNNDSVNLNNMTSFFLTYENFKIHFSVTGCIMKEMNLQFIFCAWCLFFSYWRNMKHINTDQVTGEVKSSISVEFRCFFPWVTLVCQQQVYQSCQFILGPVRGAVTLLSPTWCLW